MSKAVLISIRPEWCEKIANGEKTIEVRKTRPKLEPPFKCYIYCTNTRPYLVWGDVFRGNWETEFTHLSGYNRKQAEEIWDVFNGHVIGEFVCDRIEKYQADNYWYGTYDIDDDTVRETCLVNGALWEYAAGADLYGWHISDLVIYDEPKELSEFKKTCGFEPCVNHNFCSTTGESCPQCNIKRPPQSWCYVEELP